jgi:hypothetical protein
MSDEYNGWSNRETWATVLWIDNHEGWQQAVHEAVAAYKTGHVVDAHQIGRLVSDSVDEFLAMLLEAGDIAAYTNIRDDLGSLWRVDWSSVGEHFLAAFAENAEPEHVHDHFCGDPYDLADDGGFEPYEGFIACAVGDTISLQGWCSATGTAPANTSTMQAVWIRE